MTFLDTHLGFLEALRAAGLPVSLAEDLDAVAALTRLEWVDRETLRDGYAATLVKRHAQRPTFDALFDVYFPRMVGDGVRAEEERAEEEQARSGDGPPALRDSAAALQEMREQLVEALSAGDDAETLQLAADAVGRFGAMPGRGAGLSSWSAYTALQRVSPRELVDRIVAALQGAGLGDDEARAVAGRRIGAFTRLVEDDARRRIAEEKGARHVADVTVRPSIEQLDFMSMRRTDLEQLRRQIHPLARRLATRLTQEHHANRRGPLDFRRTVRASISTGGVPITTHHKPKRPHRTELVVLCDVSGSVANFAQFTLLLVFALRDQFQKVRAFTFIDHVHEVTGHFKPGADVVEVMADLAASTAHAALWGRTNYGRAFTKFSELHLDAIGPRTSLLILGDARSNNSDLSVPVLADLADRARHTWWLNPEHRRHWDTGDSAARAYGDVVPMVECRNLTQLGEFVHDIL
ncbi:vWA domain-containing protein [Nocardioides pacificus]